MNICKLGWFYYLEESIPQIIRMSRRYRDKSGIEPINAAKNCFQSLVGLIIADTFIFCLWRYFFEHYLFIKLHSSFVYLLITYFITGCIFGIQESKNFKASWVFCRAFNAVKREIKCREMGDFCELLNSDSDDMDRAAFLALKVGAQKVKKLQGIPWREMDANMRREQLVRKIDLFNLIIKIPTDLTEYFEN